MLSFNNVDSWVVSKNGRVKNVLPGLCEAGACLALKEMLGVLCSDMTTMMALLTPAHRQDKCVSHALQIRAAWALSNYHRFFRLYRCAPKMTGYIIDWFLERERKQALKIMIKS